jgi:hypothetical protein
MICRYKYILGILSQQVNDFTPIFCRYYCHFNEIWTDKQQQKFENKQYIKIKDGNEC